MNPKQTDRRRFLKNGAALAGLAVGASAAALPAAAAEPALEKVDELAPLRRALSFRHRRAQRQHQQSGAPVKR